ncbi:MAG: hypothetical protein Q7S84_01970 [bacterium]|nr:hypothetical protein [bacterium]
MEWLRCFGPCPACGNVDTISSDGMLDCVSVCCETCGATWKNWIQELWYPITLPIEVSITQWSARVEIHRVEAIPHMRLIVSVLNAAVMSRFKLKLCFATEGGVSGTYRHETIELININDGASFGLFDDYHFPENPRCYELLKWYGELLYTLFLDELTIGETTRRGEIFRLTDDAAGADNAKILLYAAIKKKTGSTRFAKSVFSKLDDTLSSFGGMYLAGLSDEDVARLYVPPCF